MKRVPPVLRKKKYEYSLHCYELVLEADPNSLRMHKKGRSAQEDWTVRGRQFIPDVQKTGAFCKGK